MVEGLAAYLDVTVGSALLCASIRGQSFAMSVSGVSERGKLWCLVHCMWKRLWPA